jgi:hypothetical protein
MWQWFAGAPMLCQPGTRDAKHHPTRAFDKTTPLGEQAQAAMHARAVHAKGRTMARILVQTNDYCTVLDERDVRLADIDGENAAGELLDRLERAIRDAESRRVRQSRPIRRRAAIVPARGYGGLYG